MSREIIIAGNWKMHKTAKEAKDFIEILVPLVEKASTGIMIAVPFTAISNASHIAKGTNIIVGAQNINDHDKGAFTGEISSIMLKEAGAEFVIIGHSERRHVFEEDDDLINKKVKRAILDDITPILCVGETEKEREGKFTEKVLKRQIEMGLKDVSVEDIEKVIIAYEPVWAIGTGKTATPEIAEKAHLFIRDCIKNIFGRKVSDKILILYGGSVKPENTKSLITCENIDGALVGGAALDPQSFAKIIKSC